MTHSSTSFAQGLDVRVYGVRVGRLARDPHGEVRFTPDRQWLDDNQRPPLGLAFLSNPAPRIQRGSIPIWFENLLPEPKTVMRRRICAQHDIRDRDSATLLQVLGSDLPGAVEIGGDINERDDDTTAAIDDGKLRFSLAGMQLKLSMLLTEDRFILPARGQSGAVSAVQHSRSRLPKHGDSAISIVSDFNSSQNEPGHLTLRRCS